MKLSFSTRYMPPMSLSGYLTLAKEQKFGAVEIYDIFDPCFGGEKPSFTGAGTLSTKRKLLHTGMNISQLCLPFDISDKECFRENLEKAKIIIKTAAETGVDYVKAAAYLDGDTAESFLSELKPLAKEKGVVILVETDGIYSNSAVLCEFLDRFATGSITALQSTPKTDSRHIIIDATVDSVYF